VDILFTVFCVCVYTVKDFSAEDKASGIKFCTVVHRRAGQVISHFGERCSPRSPKSDDVLFEGCADLNVMLEMHAAIERRIGMCGYTGVPEDGPTCVACFVSVLLSVRVNHVVHYNLTNKRNTEMMMMMMMMQVLEK